MFAMQLRKIVMNWWLGCIAMNKGSFTQNVAKLTAGNAIAQLISIAAVPIITRLYDPTQYGIYSIFLGVVGLIAPASTLQYQATIMIQTDDHRAWLLRKVALYAVAVVTLLTCLGTATVVFGRQYFASGTVLALDNTVIWLIAPAVLFQGMLQVNTTWIMRRNAFGSSAIARVFESVVDRGFGIVLGLLHPAAVFLASGKVLSGMVAWWYARGVANKQPGLPEAGQNYETVTVAYLARRYRSFAFYSTIAIQIFAAARELPMILLGAFYGPALAAFYALGMRVVNMPMLTVGDAISHAFFQHSAATFAKNRDCLAEPSLRLVKLGLLIAAPPLLLLSVHGQTLFGLIFGARWTEAGLYAAALAPVYLMQFVCRPVETLFDVLELQKLKVMWVSISLVSRIAAIVGVVAWGGEALIAVLGLALVTVTTQSGVLLFLLDKVGVKRRQVGALVVRLMVLLAPLVIGIPAAAFFLEAKMALLIGIILLVAQMVLVMMLDKDMQQLLRRLTKTGGVKK